MAIQPPTSYQIGDCICGYGWDCRKTGCRLEQEANRKRASYSQSHRELANRKVKLAVEQCVRELPFRLTHKIQEIRFGPDGVIDPRFEVVYMGGKVIEFENVDSFPTDADIARIALECP